MSFGCPGAPDGRRSTKVVKGPAGMKAVHQRAADAVAKSLKERGFRRHGNAFVRVSADVEHWVHFQRSRNNSTRFAVNIGVYSRRLAARLGVTPEDKSSIWECHWSSRLGESAGGDHWWDAESDDRLHLAIAEIEVLLGDADTALRAFSDTDALCRLWASGGSPGLTDAQRRKYLAMLTD